MVLNCNRNIADAVVSATASDSNCGVIEITHLSALGTASDNFTHVFSSIFVKTQNLEPKTQFTSEKS